VTDGAFNTIEESYLKEMSERLVQTTDHRLKTTDLYVGLLLGGDTKKFRLDVNTVREVIRQIKSAAEKQDINILATTSRRTPAAIEKLAREELGDYPRCKLLVIANEKNIPGVVYGILGLSGFIITSPESISMVCEAASSKKYALVFRAQGLSKKHLRLLEDFAAKKYIYLAEAHNIGNQIEKLWQTRPAIFSLRNNPAAVEEIKKLI
jgi:mitochondrial fission protein ELM1